MFLLYLILYSAGRFFIEGLRTDSLYIGGIRVSQLLSALLFIFGIAVFVIRRKHAISPEANIVPAEGPEIETLETKPEEEENTGDKDEKCEQVLLQDDKPQEESSTQDDNPQ